MGLFSLFGSIIGGNKVKKASKKAAELQYQATQQGIAEEARQYDTTRADFAPYQEAGRTALQHMSDLLGLGEPDAQAAEIAAIRGSPGYQSLYRNGEEALLADASATGGLRGGNAQRSLYGLGEDTLARLIERQIGSYGGLVGVGAGATGNVAGFGAQSVGQQNILRNEGAAAKAGDLLTRAGITNSQWMNAGSFLDDAISAAIPHIPGMGGGFGKFLQQVF